MKSLIYIFAVLILLFSCSQLKEKKEQKQFSKTTDLETLSEKLNLGANSDKTFEDWINYYKTIEQTFSLNLFDFQSVDSLIFIQGNVLGSFDNNFDSIYSDFLVYRSDKKQYVDFDSYQWTLDENKKPSFSPDQEINLIDTENQTVKRIGFRGPSQWVENAFWENDSTIVLLENSYEKHPLISKIDLKNKIIRTFKYRNSLSFESQYSELRFRKKGLKYE
jgi:hypothetical protein